jgi:hypothetical protein
LDRLIDWSKWNDPFYVEKPELSEDQIDYKGKILVTPMGFIPIGEYAVPSKNFNLWLADTNFDIDNEVIDAVKTMPGVETLDVLTRYKMRVGIGKTFDEDDVKYFIQSVLCPTEQYESKQRKSANRKVHAKES